MTAWQPGTADRALAIIPRQQEMVDRAQGIVTWQLGIADRALATTDCQQ
jgi:hypothetical protein